MLESTDPDKSKIEVEPTMSKHTETPCADEAAEPQSSLGMLLVLSGPSGVGKDTVWKATQEMLPSFCKAITCTTRARREGEEEGVHYLFVSDEEFDRLIAQNQLLEWAQVHGNRYGVPAAPVLERITAGHDVVCVIDVQGAMAVRGRFPMCLLVFLRPPRSQETGSETDTLVQRLKGRSPVSEEELHRRLETATQELAQSQIYDHQIVNDDLEQTAMQLRDIVLREKKRWQRNHPA
jgi:guanylate kinase